MQWTVRSVLQSAAKLLAECGIIGPRLDADLLLAHALGLDRTSLYTQHDRPLTGSERTAFRELIKRRARRYTDGRPSASKPPEAPVVVTITGSRNCTEFITSRLVPAWP